MTGKCFEYLSIYDTTTTTYNLTDRGWDFSFDSRLLSWAWICCLYLCSSITDLLMLLLNVFTLIYRPPDSWLDALFVHLCSLAFSDRKFGDQIICFGWRNIHFMQTRPHILTILYKTCSRADQEVPALFLLQSGNILFCLITSKNKAAQCFQYLSINDDTTGVVIIRLTLSVWQRLGFAFDPRLPARA